jgi:hypothetical protein
MLLFHGDAAGDLIAASVISWSSNLRCGDQLNHASHSLRGEYRARWIVDSAWDIAVRVYRDGSEL